MSRLEIEFPPLARSLGRRCGRERSPCSDSIKIMKTRSRHLKRLLQPKREKKSQPTWGERSSKNQPRRRSHRVCGRARRLAALFFFRECSKAKVLGGWRGAAAAAAGTYTAVVLRPPARHQMSRLLQPWARVDRPGCGAQKVHRSLRTPHLIRENKPCTRPHSLLCF
jgi:hypothetical protein